MPSQKGIHWCWAAVAAGVQQFYEQCSDDQCKIAGRVTTRKCCPYGRQAGCDTVQKLPGALGAHWAAQCDVDDPCKTPDYVKQQIDAGRPIAVRIAWSGNGGGHFVAITGYIDEEGTELKLDISDPETGLQTPWGFSQFKAAYEGNGTWDITFTTKP